MELDITKTNYLDIPLIEEYYSLMEILNSYSQIVFKKEAERDLYEDIIERFQPFSKIDEIEKNIEILNNTVFLHQKQIKKIPLSLPYDNIANLNSKGLNLLGLNIPFTEQELRRSYSNAIEKYHSENDQNIKKINDAYLLYRNFLSFEHYINNSGTKAGYFNITNGKDFYLNSYMTLVKIYTDIWELDKAHEALNYILNSEFADSSLFDDHDDELSLVIRYRIDELIKKLVRVEKTEAALYIVKKIHSQQCHDCESNSRYYPPFICSDEKKKYIKKLNEIISSQRKYNIVLIHKIQAEYAFKNNVITEKRYKDAIKRFSKKEQRIDKSQTILDTWIKENTFLKLPFDTKLEFTPVDGSVPHPLSTSNKNVYTLMPQQQNEYYLTFYIEPTIKSIDKYMYYRLYSYIFSLKEFKHKKSYLSEIIDECHLFLKIYENNPISQTSKHTYQIIFKLVEYLVKLSTISTEANHTEVFKEFRKEIIIVQNLLFILEERDKSDPYKNTPWIQKETHRKPQMSRKEILDELEDEYQDHDFFEDMISDLKDIYNYNDWGKKLCSEEFGKNFELAEELFNQAMKDAEEGDDTSSLLKVIENIASSDVLNDKEWARELFLNAQSNLFEEEYPEEDALVLFSKLITKEKYIDDKKWGKEVIQKTLEKSNEARLLMRIADIIASSDGLGDKEWAREVCLVAQKTTDGLLDFIFLGDCLAKKDGLNDREWAKENYLLAANECISSGCHEMVAEHVIDSLDDIALANKIKNMTPKKVETTIVKFTVYGGVDDKSDQIKNIIEDNHYYELEVPSRDEIVDVVRSILRNETFIKDVIYNKWEKILEPKGDDPGEYDSMLYINELIYEGKTYSKDYQIDNHGNDLFFTSMMGFNMDAETMICIGI